MNKNNDLSIVAIIPLYNGAKWIEQAIRSVLAQTLPPDEFIVVDDGSTDDGPEIVKNVAKNLAVNNPIRLLRKTNGGQSSARNFGVAHSKSALIALLDQDDFWHPNHLEVLVGPFKKQRSISLGWVYSNLDEVDLSGRLICRSMLDYFPAQHHPKRRLWDCLSQDMFVLPGASLISRQAFDAVGGFDVRLSGYEDDDLFLRMFIAGFDNVYLKQSTTYWRMHSTSTSFSARMATSRMIYFRKLVEQFPDDIPRGVRVTTDIIAPRFATLVFNDNIRRSLREGKREMLSSARSHLREIAPFLPRRHKIRARLWVFLTKWPLLAHTYVFARHIASRIV